MGLFYIQRASKSISNIYMCMCITDLIVFADHIGE